MKSTFVHLTLRRWAEISKTPIFYGAFVAFVTVGGFWGPFRDIGYTTLASRLFLSVQLNLILWFVGLGIATPLRVLLQMWGVPVRFSVVFACGFALVAIIPVAIGFFAITDGQDFSLSHMVEHSIVLVMLVSLAAYALVRKSDSLSRYAEGDTVDDGETVPVAQTNKTPRDPIQCPLQDRVPKDKQGVLYAMVAQDHYVEIITDKGSSLVLMRLADAVKIASDSVPASGPKFGIQIHRSAWISAFGVAALEKQGRRLFVKLQDGRKLPVSRSSESSLRKFLASNAVLDGNLPH